MNISPSIPEFMPGIRKLMKAKRRTPTDQTKRLSMKHGKLAACSQLTESEMIAKENEGS